MIDDLEQYQRGLKLHIAAVSDIHLGHQQTPTTHILKSLSTSVFANTELNRSLDIIFIAGDFFDSLIDPTASDLIYIRKWVAKFLYWCKENDIVLRVLKGTKLHDWDQSYIFVEENANHDIGCDLVYVDRVSIEYMDRFGIHILYVPDEANPIADQTWDQVQALMHERQLEKVDFAVMHGAFPYQLPPIAEIQHTLHDVERYLSIVRHYIFIGHIHQHSIHERIIAHGSFDRLSHGDEDPKGFIRVKNGVAKFIENTNAMRYKTLDVDGLAADQVLDVIDAYLNKRVDPCHIRLRCGKDAVAFALYRRLSSQYPFVKFTYQQSTKPKKERLIVKPELKRLPVLTRDNLAQEVLKRISETHPERVDPCKAIIEALVHAIS